MAKKLDPKIIEAARKRSSRAERREQKKQLMKENIVRNQSGAGVQVIPSPPAPLCANGERPNPMAKGQGWRLFSLMTTFCIRFGALAKAPLL